MSAREYRSVSSAQGGLLTVTGVPHVAFGDRVSICDYQNNRRNGQVIRSAEEEVLVQVFEGTDGLDLENTWVRFLDQPLEISLSPELLGRVFTGIGEPKDGRPPSSPAYAAVSTAPPSTRQPAPIPGSLSKPVSPLLTASTLWCVGRSCRSSPPQACPTTA